MSSLAAPNRSEQLATWLQNTFSEEEFEAAFAFFPPEAPLIQNLSSHYSHAARCTAAVRTLERHGAIDEAFFTLLRENRPRRSKEIDQFAHLYSDMHSDLELALAEYRARLSDELRVIDLPSLPEPDRVEQTTIELLDLFVPQNVDHDTYRYDHASKWKNDNRQTTPLHPQALDEILVSPESKWLLLLGAQGVGKSMATRWLALKLCVKGQYPETLPPGLVPVYIELRHFARKRRQTGEDNYDLFDHLAGREARHGIRRADFQRLSEAGRLVWLFDGLDEIVDREERRAILISILALRTAGGRAVLTCRLVGSELIRDHAACRGVRSVTLLDFNDGQVDSFLARWHGLAFPRDHDRGTDRRERLSATIRTNVTLRDLSRNPFLLSLIVVYMDGQPWGRRELLERATEQLLVDWDANRGLEGPIQFTHAIKRQYLEKLAWHMMTSRDGAGNVIATEHLNTFTREFCAQQFPHEQNIADSTARALLEHLRGRTCIFGYSGDGAYGFLHRTFLAFLAASQLNTQFRSESENCIEFRKILESLFATHWHEWQWRQTLALTCAFLRDHPSVVVRLLQTAVGSAAPRFPITALEILAELCITALAEAGANEGGVAKECALAVNDWLYHSPDWHGIQGTLTHLFVSVAGRWPGLSTVIARPFGRRDEAFILPFLAGLPDDEFLKAVVTRIQTHDLQPCVVHRAQDLHRWRDAFTSELQRRVVATPDPTITLVFALALAHEAFLPWPQELNESVLAAIPYEFRPELQHYFTVCKEKPHARAQVARLLRVSLTLAQCDGWPELVFSHEFSIDLFQTGKLAPKGLEKARRAFSAIAATQASTAGLFHEIVQSQDVAFLDGLLRYCEPRSRLLLIGLLNALQFHPWDEGLARVIEWARKIPGLNSFVRDALALRSLNFPIDEALETRVERSLDIYANDTPPATPTTSWFFAIHTLASQLDHDRRQDFDALLLILGRSRFPEDDLEFRLGITAMLKPGNDVQLLRLIEEATTRRPLLAASYRRSLAGPESAPIVPDLGALLADVHDEADERRLLEFAGIARWDTFWERSELPWQEIYRHLMAHGKSAAIRIEAAVELADRESIEHLHLQFPESDELAEALAFLNAREHLLHVGRS